MEKNDSERVARFQRRWDILEEDAMVSYLLNHVRKGKLLEKPNANQFYIKMNDDLHFPLCSSSQLKNKIRAMKLKFINAIQWSERDGQDILEKQGENSLKEALKQKCPYFDGFNELFGTKIKVSPPAEISILPCVAQASSSSSDDAGELNCDDDTVLHYHENGDDVHYDDVELDTDDTNNERPGSKKRKVLSKQKKTPHNGMGAFIEARRLKIDLDKERLALEEKKLEFEKTKWETEFKWLKKKSEDELALKKYEIELKYKTQLEIAKLSHGRPL